MESNPTTDQISRAMYRKPFANLNHDQKEEVSVRESRLVFQETGKTPRQLAEENERLLDALKKAQIQVSSIWRDIDTNLQKASK